MSWPAPDPNDRRLWYIPEIQMWGLRHPSVKNGKKDLRAHFSYALEIACDEEAHSRGMR